MARAQSTVDVIPSEESVPPLASPFGYQSRKITWLDFALVFAMSLWGSNFIVSKAATDLLPPIGYNAMRFTVAAVTFYLFTRIRRIDLHVPRTQWKPIVINAIIGNAIYHAFFINGLHLTTASNGVLIMTAGPVWIFLFNALRGQERIARPALFGMGLAIVGVVTVIVGRYAGQVAIGGTTIGGDLLMVIASLLWAAAILTSRGPLTRNNHLVATFWITALGAYFQTILGAPALIYFDWSKFTVGALVAVVYSGIVSIVIGSIIFNYAVNRIGTARTSIYTYVQPLVAAILAVAVLGEAFTPVLVIGGLLIFVGVALVRRA